MSEKPSCWSCGSPNDQAIPTAKVPRPPRDGDALCCLNCGEISVIAEGGNVIRKPTDFELFEIMQSSHYERGMAAVRRMRGARFS